MCGSLPASVHGYLTNGGSSPRKNGDRPEVLFVFLPMPILVEYLLARAAWSVDSPYPESILLLHVVLGKVVGEVPGRIERLPLGINTAAGRRVGKTDPLHPIEHHDPDHL